MKAEYEALFTPWKIGNVEIPNRIVMVPMEGTNLIKWESKTAFAKRIDLFYKDRKEIGLIIPGALPMISLVGGKWLYKHPEVFKEAEPVVRQIHEQGSKVFFMLTAGPGRSMPLPSMLFPLMDHKALENALQKVIPTKWYMTAPDEGEPNVWAPDKKMHQFTYEQIHQMVYAMGQTAKLCREIGVDGVEIHAVHEGYLLDQFTTKYTNHRTDAYGGSLENRLRFPCEVVQEIKKACGNDYPVSLRYSVVSKTKGFNQGAVPGEEYKEVGRDYEESARAIKILEDAGYDMFDCDNGTYDAWYWPHPPVYAPLNTNLADVEYIKPFTTKPVVCAGRMQAEAGAKAISEGKIDAMGIGRQLLCDGAYVTKIREERMDDIRPCISCHAACLPLGNTNGHGVDFDMTNIVMGRCALNPWTLNESIYRNDPAEKPKHIAVIGGGIAGMEMAIEASRRGHTVELYEKSGRLGGVFNAAAAPSFKEKDRELLKWYQRELAKTTVKVNLNQEIQDIHQLHADIIVIACGASPRRLNIPGNERAMTAEEYLYHQKETGDKVVIIGGGLTGCEIAYDLALQNKHPSIVEMTDVLVGARGICSANSTMLRDLLAFYKVPAYLNAKCTQITDDNVQIECNGKDIKIPADSVILSVGYTPNQGLKPMKKRDKKDPAVYMIGDCDKVGNLKTAIKQAYDLVQKISYK